MRCAPMPGGGSVAILMGMQAEQIRGRAEVRASRSPVERGTLHLTTSSLLWPGSPMIFPSDGHILDRAVKPSAGHADVCLR